MRYFLAVPLLVLASAVAQEPGVRPTAAANSDPEVRRATAANPAGPDEPEIRRAVPVDAPGTSEIQVRRAVAVSPVATPAAANSAAPAPQATPPIPTGTTQRALTEIFGSVYSNPSPATSPNTIPGRPAEGGGDTSRQAPQHKPTDTVVAVAWGVVFVIALFTTIMLAICLKKGIFIFLNKWDIALSLMMPIILILALVATTKRDQFWVLLFWAIFAAAIIGSLFTGWKSTGSIVLALLLFIPKIIVIYAGIIFAALSALFAVSAAQFLSMKEKEGRKYAVLAAGLSAGSGMGSYKIKNLIDRLTLDDS